MSITWIINASSSQAYIYKAHLPKLFLTNGRGEKNLELIKSLGHEASRKKTSELMSDKKGRLQGISVNGDYEPSMTPKAQEADSFAKELIGFLNKSRHKGLYDNLVIVANPTFQGHITKNLQPYSELEKMVSQRIEKDYSQLEGRKLVSQLRENL